MLSGLVGRGGGFAGGVHPVDWKYLTSEEAIRTLPAPSRVVIPLRQHIGTPCTPLVKRGDSVEEGQKIGDSESPVFSPVHASISGKVRAIEDSLTPLGVREPSIVVEADGGEGVGSEGAERTPVDLESLSGEEIIGRIREAGVVGMGGAAFPTHVKLSPPPDTSIDTVVVNGCECEPYLTADHRTMLERAPDVVQGACVIMRAVGARRAIIAVEDNKPDAIALLNDAAHERTGVEVRRVQTRYPQGAERQLVYAVTGRVVPAGGLPLQVGVVVNNVSTVVACTEAVDYGRPLIERVVTVSGDGARHPANLKVRVGTLFSDLIEACGGWCCPPGKVVMGGPMMGVAQAHTDVPVLKSTSGILLLSQERACIPEPGPCIRCGRCVDVCPMRLLPSELARCAEAGEFERAANLHALECIECGTCSYVCPARRRVVHWMRVAKTEIKAMENRSA